MFSPLAEVVVTGLHGGQQRAETRRAEGEERSIRVLAVSYGQCAR
jgi:hypothetical protein